MAIQFPQNPTIGQVFTIPSSNITLVWDGEKWTTSGVGGSISVGPPGATGATGPVSVVQGPPGPPGATGPAGGGSGGGGGDGATGATGPSGLPGPTGATGPSGATGPVSTVPGPPGATGPQGPPGTGSGGGAATIALGADPPTSPTEGQIWYDTDNTTRAYIYYQGAWIDFSPGIPGPPGATGPGAGTPTAQNTFLRISVPGQPTIEADSATDTLSIAAGTGISLTTNSSTDTLTITNTGGVTPVRKVLGFASGEQIAVGAQRLFNLPVGCKAFALLKVGTNVPARVIFYTSNDARNADNRTELEDPIPGSGVIAEVITYVGLPFSSTTGLTQVMTPIVIGYNDDGTETLRVKAFNKHSSSSQIGINLVLLPLEI